MSREKSGGISVTTLVIASASAAAAATIVPLLWAGGGVVAAAITPVIVTLVSESLKRPVTKVQEAGVWRRTPQGTAVRQPSGRDFDPVDPEEERIEVRADDPFGLYEEENGGGFFAKKKVVIALITGAIAFGVAAVVVTAGELTFGDSTKPSQTRFWGGSSRETPTPTPTPTATEEGEETPTPTPTATPGETDAHPGGDRDAGARAGHSPACRGHARADAIIRVSPARRSQARGLRRRYSWQRTGSRPHASHARLG
jgi:hypothetical protein